MTVGALQEPDDELAARVARQDVVAFETLMRRHNRRLFRVARAILGDDADAEDALQDAYLDSYRHMGEFRGDAQLATWMTRIVVNHALMRLRKRRRHDAVVPLHAASWREGAADIDVRDEASEPPPDAAMRGEVRQILEQRIDRLPVAFRTVFIMRDVEEMSVEETAQALGIPSATVRSRLFRARALLREALARDLDMAAPDVFGFAGARCDRIVQSVLGRLRAEADHPLDA